MLTWVSRPRRPPPDAKCEARVRSDVVVDANVAVAGEKLEARRSSRPGRGAVRCSHGARVRTGSVIDPVRGRRRDGDRDRISGDRAMSSRRGSSTYIHGDDLPAPDTNRLFAGVQRDALARRRAGQTPHRGRHAQRLGDEQARPIGLGAKARPFLGIRAPRARGPTTARPRSFRCRRGTTRARAPAARPRAMTCHWAAPRSAVEDIGTGSLSPARRDHGIRISLHRTAVLAHRGAEAPGVHGKAAVMLLSR